MSTPSVDREAAEKLVLTVYEQDLKSLIDRFRGALSLECKCLESYRGKTFDLVNGYKQSCLGELCTYVFDSLDIVPLFLEGSTCELEGFAVRGKILDINGTKIVLALESTSIPEKIPQVKLKIIETPNYNNVLSLLDNLKSMLVEDYDKLMFVLEATGVKSVVARNRIIFRRNPKQEPRDLRSILDKLEAQRVLFVWTPPGIDRLELLENLTKNLINQNLKVLVCSSNEITIHGILSKVATQIKDIRTSIISLGIPAGFESNTHIFTLQRIEKYSSELQRMCTIIKGLRALMEKSFNDLIKYLTDVSQDVQSYLTIKSEVEELEKKLNEELDKSRRMEHFLRDIRGNPFKALSLIFKPKLLVDLIKWIRRKAEVKEEIESLQIQIHHKKTQLDSMAKRLSMELNEALRIIESLRNSVEMYRRRFSELKMATLWYIPRDEREIAEKYVKDLEMVFEKIIQVVETYSDVLELVQRLQSSYSDIQVIEVFEKLNEKLSSISSELKNIEQYVKSLDLNRDLLEMYVIDTLLERSNLVLVSTTALQIIKGFFMMLLRWLKHRKAVIDIAIVVSASEVNPLYVLPLALISKSIVFIGDPKEFSPPVCSVQELVKKTLGSNIFEFAGVTSQLDARSILLREIKTMSPGIASIVSRYFYGQGLKPVPTAAVKSISWPSESDIVFLDLSEVRFPSISIDNLVLNIPILISQLLILKSLLHYNVKLSDVMLFVPYETEKALLKHLIFKNLFKISEYPSILSIDNLKHVYEQKDYAIVSMPIIVEKPLNRYLEHIGDDDIRRLIFATRRKLIFLTHTKTLKSIPSLSTLVRISSDEAVSSIQDIRNVITIQQLKQVDDIDRIASEYIPSRIYHVDQSLIQQTIHKALLRSKRSIILVTSIPSIDFDKAKEFVDVLRDKAFQGVEIELYISPVGAGSTIMESFVELGLNVKTCKEIVGSLAIIDDYVITCRGDLFTISQTQGPCYIARSPPIVEAIRESILDKLR